MTLTVRASGHCSKTRSNQLSAIVDGWEGANDALGVGIGFGTNLTPSTVADFRGVVNNGGLMDIATTGTFALHATDRFTFNAGIGSLGLASDGDHWMLYVYDTSDSTSPQPVLGHSKPVVVRPS